MLYYVIYRVYHIFLKTPNVTEPRYTLTKQNKLDLVVIIIVR